MSMSMSMSCSPSPSPSPQRRAPSPAPALELLDDIWFFSNTLANKPPRSPSTSTTRDIRQIMSNKGSGSVLGARKLLRTPSLPSPRRHGHVVEEEEEEEEGGSAGALLVATNHHKQQQLAVEQDEEVVDDDDLNWSSIYQGVLRTRMAGSRSSSLQRAPSMPVVPSSSSSSSSSSAMDMDDHHQTKSTPKLRHSYSTLGRHQHIFQQNKPIGTAAAIAIAKQQQQRSTSKKSGGFQDKKWKSSSDLESIEVQGFRDLGFVFDKEELRESLADVLPGLKQQQQQQQRHQTMHRGSAVPRPYLSEAWQQRPALVRVQSSSAEMKDQLRMWAQAVACNVRHEC